MSDFRRRLMAMNMPKDEYILFEGGRFNDGTLFRATDTTVGDVITYVKNKQGSVIIAVPEFVPTAATYTVHLHISQDNGSTSFGNNIRIGYIRDGSWTELKQLEFKTYSKMDSDGNGGHLLTGTFSGSEVKRTLAVFSSQYNYSGEPLTLIDRVWITKN